MLKELFKSMMSSIVSRLSRTAPRTTNQRMKSSTLNTCEEILTYKILIVPERDSLMVFPNEVSRYNWATSAKQEQELTDVFTRIEHEGLW
jgi:hypothetical protein